MPKPSAFMVRLSLFFEYRKHREQFLMWIAIKSGGADDAAD